MKDNTVKQQSLLSKIAHFLRHNALVEMFLDPAAGMVVDPEEVDTEKQIKDLSAATGVSEKDLLNIDAQFNGAHSNLEGLTKQVEKIPDEPKESKNPFAVDPEDLNLDGDAHNTNRGSKKKSKSKQAVEKELGE